MKRKFVLAAVLCLAVAALGIGAAPALAVDGCTCHTVEPPTATAAHAPLVVGVTDCTTCHKGWAVPHPELAVPSLTLTKPGWGLFGRFVAKAKGINGVVVYLQQRLWGETAFTDLTQVTTQTHIMGSTRGWFYFPMQHPTPWAAYRAVSEGVAGLPVVVPGERVWLPKPKLTLKLSGLRNGAVRVGRTVGVRGTVTPADLETKAQIVVQKRVAGKWVTRSSVKRAFSATGIYSWSFKPGSRGLFRVRASAPATPQSIAKVTAWRSFRAIAPIPIP